MLSQGGLNELKGRSAATPVRVRSSQFDLSVCLGLSTSAHFGLDLGYTPLAASDFVGISSDFLYLGKDKFEWMLAEGQSAATKRRARASMNVSKDFKTSSTYRPSRTTWDRETLVAFIHSCFSVAVCLPPP